MCKSYNGEGVRPGLLTLLWCRRGEIELIHPSLKFPPSSISP